MRTSYESSLKAHISRDDGEKVRHIRHSQEHWLAEETAPRRAAGEYLQAVAETLEIPHEELRALQTPAQDLEPREQGVEYRFGEEKRQFDGSTIAYVQTYLDVPVFRRGVSVQVKQAPTRILSVTDNSEPALEGKLPSEEAIARYRKLFEGARPARAVGEDDGPSRQEQTTLRKTFARPARGAAARDDNARLLGGRFVVYKYEPSQRYGGHPAPPEPQRDEPASLEDAPPPFIELPPVSDDITPGRAYLTAELITRFDVAGFTGLVWLALVEVESGSVLYLECLTQGVNGMVFRRDPMVATGDLTITADDSEAVLSLHDSDELLNALDPPVRRDAEPDRRLRRDPGGGEPGDRGADAPCRHRTSTSRRAGRLRRRQRLLPHDRAVPDDGGPRLRDRRLLRRHDVPDPRRPPRHGHRPSMPTGPRTARAGPITCASRSATSRTPRSRSGARSTRGCTGTRWADTARSATTSAAARFGFCHSAGDGLAALQMDPESALRALPERFRYAPFRPFTTERRFDRAGARVGVGRRQRRRRLRQRADPRHLPLPDLPVDRRRPRRPRPAQFASRVDDLPDPACDRRPDARTNPSNWNPATSSNVPGRGAELWSEDLQATDHKNWDSEGLSGGAYNKVIRWSFEEQGTYSPGPRRSRRRPPASTSTSTTAAQGEYPFQPVHWHNTSMWNRNAPTAFRATRTRSRAPRTTCTSR